MTERLLAPLDDVTERLRALLDERGVEWWQKKRHTCWKVGKGQEVEIWRAWEAPDGSITLKVDYIYHLTPEQAIAATLGSGECHEVMIDRFFRGCGECGYMWEYMYGIGKRVRPNFCPNCGRRIVGPTTNDADAEVTDG